jgi:WD40 repeat protein
VPLLGDEVGWLNGLEFSPDGSWLVEVDAGNATLWNMRDARSTVLARQDPRTPTVAFTPDGHLLSSSDEEGVLRRRPLSPEAGEGVQTLWSQPGALIGISLEVDPGGRFVVLAGHGAGKLYVVPLDGSKPVSYQVKARAATTVSAFLGKLDPSGRFLAMSAFSVGHPDQNSIWVLDLTAGDEWALDTHAKGEERCEELECAREGLAFPVWLRDGRLVPDGDAGLRVWNLETGTSERLRPCRKMAGDSLLLLASPDSRMVLRLEPVEQQGSVSSLSAFDLPSSAIRGITSHGNKLYSFALDASGKIFVTGGQDGVVRAAPLTGEEPHLLFGHTARVASVAVSPDGRWITSVSDDGTIRLWPMPDLSKPPLHTLPHDQLVAKLKSLTNLRAVRDPSSDTGWKIEIGPFPGWTAASDWQP